MKKYLRVPAMHISIDVAVLILRVSLSVLMLTHGYPKLEKILNGDWSFGDPLGIGSQLSLLLTVFAEFFCSLLLIVGYLSRPALFFLTFTMFVAAFIVHGEDGLAKQEKALLYFFGYLSLFLIGPGRLSLDAKVFGGRRK